MIKNNKRYIVKHSQDVLKSVKYFCDYYKLINQYINEQKIISSLDRGAFSHPKQILNKKILALLGQKRNKISYAYGAEAGEYVIRNKICEIENIKYKTKYNTNNIAIVAGAWNGVELVLEELANLKRGKAKNITIAVIGPTHYQMFHRAINIIGINVIGFDFIKPSAGSMPINIDEIKDVIKAKPRAIFITNPNNPNGEYFPADILKELVKICEHNNIYLIIDEIQDFFPAKLNQGLNYGNWIQSPNVIRIDSFSKKRGLAEYRIGWVIANEHILGNRTKGIIGRLNGLMGNAPRAANTAILKILEIEEEKIKNKKDIFQPYWDDLSKKENFILNELNKMKNVSILPRQSCINLTVKINSKKTDLRLAEDLMRVGTLIMPCSGYGYDPHDTVMRITFAERWKKIKHSI